MATVYSGEVAVGTYNRIRIKCDYSGTSATLSVEFRRTSSWSDYWYDAGATLAFNGVTKAAAYSYSGTVGTSWITLVGGISGYSVSMSGGTYNWTFSNPYGGVLGCSGTITIPAQHSAPTGVSASVASGQTAEAQGGLQSFSVSSWHDTGSGTRYYAVTNSSKTTIADWTTSTSATFPIPASYISTNVSTTQAYGVYAAAKNYNGDIGYSGIYYITSPSAPTLTFTGSASTAPTCVPKATITYKGGTTNSSTADSASMSKWNLCYKKNVSGESYPSTPQQTSSKTDKTADDFTSISSAFEADKNYNVRVRAVNTYGGTSESEATLYCPVGVAASKADATVPLQLTFTFKANSAGTVGSATGGTMACYQLSYVELDSQGHEVGSWVTKSKQTSTTCLVTGLEPLTTYKYHVQGWNNLGLSSISGDATVTTAPKFYPEFDGKLTFGPKTGGNGVVVSGKILHPGGDTIDDSRVTTLYLYMRQKGTASWGSPVTQLTGKSIGAGGTFSFNAVGDTSFLSYGNYEFYARATNALGDSGDSQISELSAPSGVYITAAYDPAQITMIAATGATEDTNAKTWTLNYKTGSGAAETKTVTVAAQTADINSHNHLLFGTTYQVWIVVTNAFGLKQESAKVNVTIPARFSYQYAKANGQVVGAAASVKPIQSANTNIADIYTVVKDALGNLATGTNLKNKRLVFPTDMLRYRPENVADMTLSNGRKIAYRLDASADTYKFGIWNGDTIQTTFFNGTTWAVDHYDFGTTNLTISAVSALGNMNKSSAFSMTKCIDIPDWDRS